MATATPPAPIDRDHGRIRHPLDRLRKYINTYVLVEAVALVALVFVIAFWAGFWADFGFFKAFTFDWVQATPWAFRLVILAGFCLLMVAMVAFVSMTRFFKEFRDGALALVLERRFPDVLGDRLITAVELHNPKKAAQYGYSPDLVAQTIHEAADRVEQVPVAEVFAWKRLYTYGLVLLYLTVGLYALTAAGFAADSRAHQAPLLDGVSDFHEVAEIWAERNLLLRNVLWPRRSYLEMLPLDVAKKGREPRIAKDQPAPTLRVRAWKYVIADRTAPEGWRLLTWQDLRDRPALAGGHAVPQINVAWTPRDHEAGLTVDEVELRLDSFVVRKKQLEGSDAAVFCTPDAEGGWRQLMWSDLTKDKLGGLGVPVLPGEWGPKARAATGASGVGLGGLGGVAGMASRLAAGSRMIDLSVDDVEKARKAAAEQLAQEKDQAAKKRLEETLADVDHAIAHLEHLVELRNALDAVDGKTTERGMHRTMRKLKVPDADDVTLYYRGRRTVNTATMKRVADNEFIGNFSELKETITYYVRGEDYVTPTQRLIVVELPRLEKLESEEERPAYLYYRPTDPNKPDEMRGKRQKFAAVGVSLSGDVTTIEVPAGTTMTLTATSSKPLQNVWLRTDKKDARNLKLGEVKLTGEKTFELVVEDVRREQRFTFEYEDVDDVKGRRAVLIQPREDVAPRIREFNPDDVIRKGKEGYIVSANARVPFKGRMRDDYGLAKVRYGCKVIPADFLSEQKLMALDGVMSILPLGRPETRLLATRDLMSVLRRLNNNNKDEAGDEQHVDLPAFRQMVETNRLRDGRLELLEPATVAGLLSQPQREPFRRLLTDFGLIPDNWTQADEEATDPRKWVRAQDGRAPIGFDLPLWLLRHKDEPLKERDLEKPQKRFIVEVRLLAADTYTEGELDPKTKQPLPHTSPSSETFTFVVVPDNELLAKIGEEEDAKQRDLLKQLKPLNDARDRMSDAELSLSASVTEPVLNGLIARCDTVDEALKVAHADVMGVKSAYERIVREMRLNQLDEHLTSKVFKEVALPLARLSDVQFGRAIESVRVLRRAVDNKDASVAGRAKDAAPKATEAKKQLNELVSQLRDILDKMKGISDINELIRSLVEIDNQESKLEALIKKVRAEVIRQLTDPNYGKSKE